MLGCCLLDKVMMGRVGLDRMNVRQEEREKSPDCPMLHTLSYPIERAGDKMCQRKICNCSSS